MNTPNQKDLEQNVIQAARTLAAEYLHEANTARQLAFVPVNMRRAQEALADSKLALAEADMNIAAAHFRYLTAEQKKRKDYLGDSSPVALQLVAARKHLWSIAMGGDDQAVLQAAREYGEKVNAYWLQCQQNGRLTAACAEAMEACRIAAAERRNVLEKHEQAIAGEVKARADSNAIYAQKNAISQSYEIQRELDAAVLAMTGMQGKGSSFRSLTLAELDFTLP